MVTGVQSGALADHRAVCRARPAGDLSPAGTGLTRRDGDHRIQPGGRVSARGAAMAAGTATGASGGPYQRKP
ncbi:hypothetical protein Aph02nite_77850 [Actinoplanes philippinensis]|nr:hypothetical protein Aph02nite_77850 [Actinoplanes philippinensis]